jgi:deazaflavin-dependent oxidoreductase (nitroreductase family)
MPAYRRLIRWLGHKRWFAAFAVRFGSTFDRLAYRATRGRLTATGSVAPLMLLTTTGRRTGRERTTPVIYIKDGERFIVSSEEFGQQKRRAAWPRNLDADPRANVQIGSRVIPCRARRLGDDEAERYWPRLVAVWPAHETYLRRSGRRHTFVLEPVEKATSAQRGGDGDGAPLRELSLQAHE